MTTSNASALTIHQFRGPTGIPGTLTDELADCWASVINSGGAVIPADCPPPPLTPADVVTAVEGITRSLAPEHGRLVTASLDGALAGWLAVRRERHPLEAHCGVLNHVQTQVHLRRRGIGAALLRAAHRVAGEEMGIERLKLSVRAGLGIEEFYRAAGWTEVGRWPGALRLAPGDDRDEILMSIALRRQPAPRSARPAPGSGSVSP
ncbi:N-acetyltransferase family protein [Streptomyces ardesiacus]